MDIGAKLRSARTRAGLTQEQAAQAARVSRQTMSSWENGRSMPDIISVARLAEIYGISLDALVREQEEAPEEQLSFLQKYWDVLYSAAVASIPAAVLAGYFLSEWAALLFLILGAVIYALPRLRFYRMFGSTKRHLTLGLLGWTMVILRTLWMLNGGAFTLAAHLMMMVGVALVLYGRLREQGGWKRSAVWHQWVVLGLLALSLVLPWLSGAVDDGDFNEANPFEHPYRIAEVEYGEGPGSLLVELGYENALRFLDVTTDTAVSVGHFTYQDPAEGAEAQELAGIWELVPEDAAGMRYRLSVDAQGIIRLSHWEDEVLQWRYRLERADALRWSVKTTGQVSGGVLEWFPAGVFDGNLDRLNCAVIVGGSGTVAIVPEEPVEVLTLYVLRDGVEDVNVLEPNESGGFSLALSGEPGEVVTCRVPWADGDYWFMVEFE